MKPLGMNKILAKKMLFDVTDVFEHLKIEVFLTSGTCLGAYRERDFIAWDEDIDLCVKAEELAPKLQLWIEAITKKGYWVARRNRSFIRMGISVWKERGKGLHLDMNALYLIDDKRWLPGPDIDVAFSAHLFEDPERIDFLGRTFSIPTPVTEYLEQYYGPDYMIPMRRADGWAEISEKVKVHGRFDRHKVPKELR